MIGKTITLQTGGGGGGSGSFVFSPIKQFKQSDIGAISWAASDGQSNMNVDGGTYTATAGEYVEVNATNQLRMSFPVNGSYYLFGIRVQVDPDFTPINTNNWYDASCLIGQELSGEQRDFAIIIDKNGYFALGWANSTITSSTVSALDGATHDLFVYATGANIYLFIDGIMAVSVSKTMNSGQMSQLGVMWNRSGFNTRVNGKVYAVGYWDAVTSYDLPSFA